MEDLATQKIIGAAIYVHRQLGPGLLESTYEMCLAEELKFQKILFERQCSCPVIFRGISLESAYRIDFLVEKSIIIEIKSVESLTKIHTAQLLTYLRLLNLKKGLLININESLLTQGIKRFSNEKGKRINPDSEFSLNSAISKALR